LVEAVDGGGGGGGGGGEAGEWVKAGSDAIRGATFHAFGLGGGALVRQHTGLAVGCGLLCVAIQQAPVANRDVDAGAHALIITINS
jgi:hypothetical protein